MAPAVNATMNYLSLYDALVSLNVPGNKARAVVEAMEREMSATLATKADLELLRKDVELMAATLTIRLGSLMVVGMSLLFAALKYT
jgi:hypothetical protein